MHARLMLCRIETRGRTPHRVAALCHGADGKASLNDRGEIVGSHPLVALHQVHAEPGWCAPFALWALFLPQNRPAQHSASISLSYGPLNFRHQSSRLSSPPFDLLSFDLSSKAPHDKICCLELLHECPLFDSHDHVRQLLVSAGRGR